MFADDPPSDTLLAYLGTAQPCHEDLQRVLTQAAGYALLVMTRERGLVLLDAPVVAAKAALAEARCTLEGMRVPAGARHHVHHMSLAAGTIGASLDMLLACLRPTADDAARTALVRALRSATDHLRTAARLLPGFEMVDLSQACCAAHVGQQASMLTCQAVEG